MRGNKMQRKKRKVILRLVTCALCALTAMCDRHNDSAAVQPARPAEAAMAQATTAPILHGRLRFLALGDSYTFGQNVEPADRWPVQLAQRLRQRGFDVDDPQIIARTGWSSGDLLQALDHENPQPPFALVTMLIGVNNQFSGRLGEEYRQEFVRLLHRAVDLTGGDRRRVIVLSIPDWSVTPFGSNYKARNVQAEITAFNLINQKESQYMAVAYVDITPETRLVATHPELVADDGLHPSRLQYAQWVDLSLDAASAALNGSPPTTAPSATQSAP